MFCLVVDEAFVRSTEKANGPLRGYRQVCLDIQASTLEDFCQIFSIGIFALKVRYGGMGSGRIE